MSTLPRAILLAALVWTTSLAAASGPGPQPGPRDAPLPDGCAADAGHYLCRWSFNDTDRAAGGADAAAATELSWRIPVFASTLATVEVQRYGPDDGWSFVIEAVVDDETGPRRVNVSASQHAQQTDASVSHHEKTTHLVLALPDAEHWLRFTPGNAQVRQAALPLPLGAPSRYQVIYVGERLPEGEAPTRPAATADDPQMADIAGDTLSNAPDHDIIAAWFDDARVGDGLMDAHLRVADLSRVTFSSGAAPAFEATRVDWKVVFSVRGEPYYVAWEATRGSGPGSEAFTCALRRESVSDTESEELLATPACVFDRTTATFHASFPTRSIGAPASGEAFADLTARSRVHEATGSTTVVDDGPEVRYAFALGGPAVWHGLNPRLTREEPAPLAWHEDPLASENLPDTLQVAGAILAALTFLGGLVLVARARRATRDMLGRIDAIERGHENDTRRALLELGVLETELTRDFREGRIREAQYQVAAQRISSVAARFALRRDLGLDDGEPDAVRVPVRDADATARREL